MLGTSSSTNQLNSSENYDHRSSPLRKPAFIHCDLLEKKADSKLARLQERLSFVEDALSRIELQQDSMRPLLKSIETMVPPSQASNKPVAFTNPFANVFAARKGSTQGGKENAERQSQPVEMETLRGLVKTEVSKFMESNVLQNQLGKKDQT